MTSTTSQDPSRRHQEARTAEERGEITRARTLYGELAQDFPDDKRVLDEAATALARLGHLDDAVAILEAAAERMNGSPFILNQLARLFADARRWREASAAMARVVNAAPSDLTAFLQWCYIIKQGGLERNHVQVFQRSVLHHPNDYDVAIAEGVIMQSLNAFAMAEIAFRRALGIRPDSVDAALGLGIALTMTDKFDEAVDITRALVTSHAKCLPGYINLSRILLRKKQLFDALVAADAAVALNAKDTAGHRARGFALLEMKQPVLAAMAFRRVLAVVPDDPEAALALGNAEARQ